MNYLIGFRTIIVGLLMAIGVPALSYLAGVDWTAFGISPTISIAICGLITIAMRIISRTPVAQHNAVSAVAAMPDQELREAGVVKMLVANTIKGEKLANLTPGHVVTSADEASSVTRRHA